MSRRERLPDHETVCRAVGVRLCPGPPGRECGVSSTLHHEGFVRVEAPPTVHYRLASNYVPGAKRGATRSGIYRVLKLAYLALNNETLAKPRWERIYDSSRAAVEVAKAIGVVIGRGFTEYDRTKVKFLLSDPAQRDTPKKEQAWKWAQKRYD